MQVHKLHEQQEIKPAMKQTSTDARIAVLESKLVINSEPIEGDIKKTEGKTLKEPAWRRDREHPVVTPQALGSYCKEPS